MKKLLTSLLLLAFLTLSFQTAKSQNGPVKLTYNYPAGQAVKYLNTNKIVQNMDVNGQSMEADVNILLSCSIHSTGNQASGQNLEVTIDSLSEAVESPQGAAGGAASDLKGKSFSMILATNGKPDLTEASKIMVNVPGNAPVQLDQSFYGFFPVLPAGEISPGYTWTTNDTIDKKEPTVLYSVIKSNNTFDGFENINGTNCVRIISKFEGVRNMTNESQGMEIKTSGNMSGTSTVYFAPSLGYFLKHVSVSKLTGQMEISTMGMTFPVVMDINITNEVQK